MKNAQGRIPGHSVYVRFLAFCVHVVLDMNTKRSYIDMTMITLIFLDTMYFLELITSPPFLVESQEDQVYALL